jgi:hypothetical protein
MARLSAAAEVRLLEASEQQLIEELAQYRKAMKNLQQMIRRESQSVNDRLHEDVYLVAALVYTLSGTVDLAVLYLKWKAASLQSVPAPVGPELDLATATEVVVNLLPVIPQLVAIPHLLRSAVLWIRSRVRNVSFHLHRKPTRHRCFIERRSGVLLYQYSFATAAPCARSSRRVAGQPSLSEIVVQGL